MRLLSFDIECSQVYKGYSPICNFGYVLYNEDFELIEKKDLIINPKAKFKLEGRKNQADIKLFYTEREYKDSKPFPYFYNEIKKILESDNQLILNHAVINDLIYLNNECRRYKLPIFNFEAYDTMDIYRALNNFNGSLSLEKVYEQFCGDQGFIGHKADEDANAAMNFFIEICKLLEVKPSDLISMASIKKYYSNLEKNNKSNKVSRKTTSDTKVIQIGSDFKDKKISISFSIQKDINKYESILYSVKQLGGEITLSVSNSNIFIYEEKNHCKRCDSYIYNLEHGNSIIGYDYNDYMMFVSDLLKNALIKNLS